ncbi:bitter taste receptor Modo-T2R7B [Monodelphis domestica]|uniref:Taste receptor type 2 n=1 Tax=Monodelphis domestica TaxID=13616 RepID=Q2AB99_MONDO|nr:bitter taste receptor Modo-T2R7B [Monodelphis domestica]BAE80368.1 bitter taste receptor [Monodelphis domestica]
MLNALKTIFIILMLGEFIMGVLGNGFIGLVNFIDWIKKRKIYLVDLILTSLAISRISLLCIMMIDGLVGVFFPEEYTKRKFTRILDGFWTISNLLNVWFATCLSTFYCLKIASFSHPLFLWLKLRINRVIPVILLASIFISVFTSLPITEIFNEDVRSQINKKHKENNTSLLKMSKGEYVATPTLLNLGLLFPFTVSLISFFLLILSMWKHTRKIKLNAVDTRDASTEIHLRAMKAVISFLILFVIYCLAILIATFSYVFPDQNLAMICGEITAVIYPAGHSFILILGNIKLRRISLNALQQAQHCLKGGKSLVP